MAERFVRTIKSKLWRHFTITGTKRWIGILDDAVYAYNHSKHRTIGMCPNDVNKLNEMEVWNRIYGNTANSLKKPKFNLGDNVRITKSNLIFRKAYAGGWSNEIFTIIDRVRERYPYMYIIRDSDNEIVKGAFYEHEMQMVTSKGKGWSV